MVEETPERNSESWISEQLSISHLYNESSIKSKQAEMDNISIKNEQAIADQENHYLKKTNMMLNQISKLRSTIAYLETELNTITNGTEDWILKTKLQTVKTIDSINLEIKENCKLISELQNSIQKQRDHFRNEIDTIKKEKRENMEQLNDSISELYHDLKEAEIKIFSPNPDIQSIYEIQSTTAIIKIDIEETQDSIIRLQRRILNEQLHLQELNQQLEHAEHLSASFRQDISTLRNRQ